MGRESRLNTAGVYRTIGQQLSQQGGVKLSEIAKHSATSIGSLYHRFGSREGVLAHTWLDAVDAFQAYFIAAIEQSSDDDIEQGVAGALATPRFCRNEFDRAVVLACCRRTEFLSAKTPAVLREKIAHVNDEGAKALRRYVKRSGLSFEACRAGLVGMPLGVVRLYLPHRAVPRKVDGYIAAAFRATVEIG